jgi:hypothetical protein
MGVVPVADVVRHLKTADCAFVFRDVGILTNSATKETNLAKTLGCYKFRFENGLYCWQVYRGEPGASDQCYLLSIKTVCYIISRLAVRERFQLRFTNRTLTPGG